MALLCEIVAEFNVVEDLTVECDPQRAVSVRHRLTAAREINDAQSRVSECGLRLDVHAAVIRAAMREHPGHGRHAVGIESLRFSRHDASNAAHGPMSVLSKAVAMAPARHRSDRFDFLIFVGGSLRLRGTSRHTGPRFARSARSWQT